MKKFTKLLLALTLCVLGVGSANAERTYGSISVVYQATWDSSTKTMGWKEASSGAWYILNTGLPKGNISAYATFHANLSDFSDNADFIRLIIKDGTTQDVVRLVEGENSVDLKSLPNCDYTKITEVYLWGSDAAKEGKTINADNPASVVVTDVYFEKPDAPFVSTVAALGEEITDIKYITDGGKFVAVGNDGKRVQTYLSSAAGASSTNVESVTSDMYYYLQLAAAPDTLDVNQDGTVDVATYYSIGIYNASGVAKPSNWWGANYICRIGWGDLWSTNFAVNMDEGKITTNHFGRDNAYSAVWTVEYEKDKGFKFYNPQSNTYMNVSGTQGGVYYLKLYKSIEYISTTLYPANDEIFALSKATGFNSETGEMTNGTWTFETPADLSNWKYIIIAMEDGCANTSCEIKIIDNNGTTVKGEDYVGTDAGTGPNMWFSRWNHQNIGCLSLGYLKDAKGLDIENVKSLSISGTTKPFAVYLSCYDNSKLLSTNRWFLYKEGDLIRSYAKADVGNFGTICLPYKASCAGAEVYSIAGNNGSAIALTKVNGLLEAGKPYLYKASDNVGQDNGGEKCNVNFFRADFDRYDVSAPVENNGLIGTFTATTAPAGTDYLILSANKLWNTEGCTGDDAVNIGANKAYIDKTKIVNKGASARLFLPFGDVEEEEVTGIQTVKVAKNNGIIFNLNGQRMNKLTKGLNIIAGKKVLMK